MNPKAESITLAAAEQFVASIYCELLERDEVGLEEDFFDLGGHSLTVVRLVARLEEKTGTRLSVRDAFDLPTISQLARLLQTRSNAPTTSL